MFLASQMFNRVDDMKALFPGQNPIENLGVPMVLFAPVGSGKSTLLQSATSVQPHTLMCTLRASEPTVMGDDNVANFVRNFSKSIGLPPRSLLLEWIEGARNVSRPLLPLHLWFFNKFEYMLIQI
jgi:hypothetical protein